MTSIIVVSIIIRINHLNELAVFNLMSWVCLTLHSLLLAFKFRIFGEVCQVVKLKHSPNFPINTVVQKLSKAFEYLTCSTIKI